MTNCKGCPFLYDDKIEAILICNLEYTVDSVDGLVTSKDCKLELVQYTLKDKSDSITFIPNEYTSEPEKNIQQN
jgi:hypothetical protein